MNLDPQAIALNQQIKENAPAVFEMLSARGRAIYFPRQGIIAQTSEAQGKKINATIGIALEEDGSPMCLPCIAGSVRLPAGKIFSYASNSGRADMRQAWQRALVTKNPSLVAKSFSLPIVTAALTHGLSMAGYLFCEDGDRLIFPDLYWENYDLIFGKAFGACPDPFPMFADGAFNVAGLREKLQGGKGDKVLVILNFPNNPTGYTPTKAEVSGIVDALQEAAARGQKLVVLVDDAYFGLVYEPDVFTESIFGPLCNLHPNLLAVKLDGPTKEDYVWGFRVGFLTFGVGGATPQVYAALEAKVTGAIRGNISNVSNLGQSLLVGAYLDPAYAAEKRTKYEVLHRRYKRVKQVLAEHPEYQAEFAAMPYNSGYFMCLRMLRADPEKVRQKLLTDFSTGVIVMSGLVRLAFSCTPLEQIEDLFANIYQAAQAVGTAQE